MPERKPKPNAPRMDIETALSIVDDDLPDGAWMAMLCELTGGDAGDVASMLYEASEPVEPDSKERLVKPARRRKAER